MTSERFGDSDAPGQPSGELLEQIRDLLWTFSVFVFGVDDREPHYLGGATCVAHRGSEYLLTAAHVWSAIRGDTFALALNHDRPLIELRREFIQPSVLLGWERPEWGPDLALLRLPDVVVAEIRLLKAFYNLDRPRPEASSHRDWRQVILWVVAGAPLELSTIKPEAAMLRHCLFDTWACLTCEREGFDYHDLAFDHESRPGLPQSSYGGVSGAGLWQIPVAVSAQGSPRKIRWDRSVRLAGVAFYELPRAGHESSIRCHGHKALKQALDVAERLSGSRS